MFIWRIPSFQKILNENILFRGNEYEVVLHDCFLKYKTPICYRYLAPFRAVSIHRLFVVCTGQFVPPQSSSIVQSHRISKWLMDAVVFMLPQLGHHRCLCNVSLLVYLSSAIETLSLLYTVKSFSSFNWTSLMSLKRVTVKLPQMQEMYIDLVCFFRTAYRI